MAIPRTILAALLLLAVSLATAPVVTAAPTPCVLHVIDRGQSTNAGIAQIEDHAELLELTAALERSVNASSRAPAELAGRPSLDLLLISAEPERCAELIGDSAGGGRDQFVVFTSGAVQLFRFYPAAAFRPALLAEHDPDATGQPVLAEDGAHVAGPALLEIFDRHGVPTRTPASERGLAA